METIINYLDNMFINFPQTPEVLRAKENLAEMMEDKYNELIEEGKMVNEAIGIVISEFGNIKELTDELGVYVEENKLNETKKNTDSEPNETKKNADSELNETKKSADSESDGTKKNTDSKPNETQKNADSELYKIKLEKEENEFVQTEKQHSNKHKKAKSKQKSFRHLSNVEVEEYLFAVKQSAEKIAAGVFLCICSPVLILLLNGISSSIIYISDRAMMGAGIPVLLFMIASAVGLFISAGMKLETYEYLKKECFSIDKELEQSICNIKESRKGLFTTKIIIGVIMCILSVLPLIVLDFITNSNEFADMLGVVIILVSVGIAVILFITAGMEEDSYNIILQKKDYSMKKKANKLENAINAIYWPLVGIIYLMWSFISDGWGVTWMIWPIAGILYRVIGSIC